MKIPFAHLFKSSNATPPAIPAAPVAENTTATAPAPAPVPSAENYQPGWQAAAPYFRESSITMEMQMAAAATRRENREIISRLQTEQRTRQESARIALEAEDKARQERAEAEKNRPKTWEDNFRRVADDQPALTKPLVQHLIAQAGCQNKIFALLKKLRTHTDAFSKLDDERRSIGPRAAQALLRDQVQKQFAAAQRGENTPPVPLPAIESLERDFAHRRILLKERMKASEQAAKPIVSEIGELLQTASRKLALELLQQERASASALQIPYEPSVLLRVTASAGFTIQHKTEIENVLVPLTDTNGMIFGLLADVEK